MRTLPQCDKTHSSCSVSIIINKCMIIDRSCICWLSIGSNHGSSFHAIECCDYFNPYKVRAIKSLHLFGNEINFIGNRRPELGKMYRLSDVEWNKNDWIRTSPRCVIVHERKCYLENGVQVHRVIVLRRSNSFVASISNDRRKSILDARTSSTTTNCMTTYQRPIS